MPPRLRANTGSDGFIGVTVAGEVGDVYVFTHSPPDLTPQACACGLAGTGAQRLWRPCFLSISFLRQERLKLLRA